MAAILEKLVDVLWGLPLIIGLLGTGIYFLIRTKFWHLRHFGYIMKSTFGNLLKERKKEDEGLAGILTPLQATSIALASAIGVGNIGGVASAISYGGPGALFWIWVTAFIGMGTKMAEVALGVHYREQRLDGSTYGGPPYYIERGLGEERGWKIWKPLAVIFGIGIFGTWFIALETYTISEAMSVAFNVNQIGFATVYILLVYGVVLGGFKRLGKFAEFIIPPMSLFYIVAGLAVLGANASQVPEAFRIIFKSAFTHTAAVGGFGGAALIITIRTGVSRSLWSNEAGWGTSPMAHATAKTNHPIKQSMWGVFEVFVDTILICSITGLVIVTTGAWKTGIPGGAELTLKAFEMGLGKWASVIVAVSTFLFGWTTATGWYSYYSTVLKHGFKKNPKIEEVLMKLQTYFYPIPGWIMTLVVVFKGMPSDVVWLFSDLITAIPTYINLFVILVLSNRYMDLLNDYSFKHFGRPIPDSSKKIKLFYEDETYQKYKLESR